MVDRYCSVTLTLVTILYYCVWIHSYSSTTLANRGQSSHLRCPRGPWTYSLFYFLPRTLSHLAQLLGILQPDAKNIGIPKKKTSTRELEVWSVLSLNWFMIKHESSSACGVKITHSPIALANLSFTDFVSIFMCSSPSRNPVYPWHVDPSVLVISLPSHRHSHISLLFIFHFIVL